MIHPSIDRLQPTDIEQLVSDEVLESRELDYKAELPGGSDGARKEFAADLASFANSTGGYIIYGISERRDAAGKTTGYPEAIVGLQGFNADDAIRRLEGMARSNIDPVIPGLRFRALECAGGSVVVVRIPRSWQGPHMVAVGGDSRFYARASMSKHPMDVQEIRSSFALSTDVPNLVRRRRDDRLGRILADDTPVVLSGSDRLVVHLIPFASVGTDQAMALPPWTQPALAPPGASGHTHRYNIDGVLSHDGGTNRAPQAYLQVFRTGFLEAVQSDILRRSGDGLFLPPRSVEETVLECLESYLMRCAANGVDAPIVVAVSLLAVRGAQVPPTYRRHIRPFPFERDVMLLPEIILNSVPTAVATAMRPCFDALSQAFGISRSLSYDEHGHWTTEFQW